MTLTWEISLRVSGKLPLTVSGWYLFHEETKQEVLKTITVTRQL